MGTNYYLTDNHCKCCDRYNTSIHLGKSSGGWTFTFRGYRQTYSEDYNHKLNIQTFDEWCELIKEKVNQDFQIRDEYRKFVTPEELFDLVEKKRDAPHNHAREHPDNSWLDADGNSFTDNEFC